MIHHFQISNWKKPPLTNSPKDIWLKPVVSIRISKTQLLPMHCAHIFLYDVRIDGHFKSLVLIVFSIREQYTLNYSLGFYAEHCYDLLYAKEYGEIITFDTFNVIELAQNVRQIRFDLSKCTEVVVFFSLFLLLLLLDSLFCKQL